ncbi:MAG: peptidoglycan DD-metalloendopeptidase family protein [Bdellovibrionota bacterium]
MKAIFFAGFILLATTVWADQNTNASQELQAVEKKIEQQKKQLKEIEGKRKNILGDLQNIDKKKDQYASMSTQAKKDIDGKQRAMQQTQSEITEIQKKLNQQKDFMKAHIKHLYQHGSINVLQTWFQKMESNDRRRQNVWITHWVEKEKAQVVRYESDVEKLTAKQDLLLKQKKEKEILLQEVQTHQKNLEAEKTKKNTLLASIKNQKQLYQQSLLELEEASRKIQKLINQFDEAPSVDEGAFEQSRGALSPPVTASIVRKYGAYEDKTLKAQVHHKGIDYAAKLGDQVRCIFQGKVMYAGWFEGYGKVVIVDHWQSLLFALRAFVED